MEIKTIFLASQTLSFRLSKQTSKHVVDATFKNTEYDSLKNTEHDSLKIWPLEEFKTLASTCNKGDCAL